MLKYELPPQYQKGSTDILKELSQILENLIGLTTNNYEIFFMQTEVKVQERTS